MMSLHGLVRRFHSLHFNFWASQIIEHDRQRNTVDSGENDNYDNARDAKSCRSMIRGQGNPIEDPEDHEVDDEDEEKPGQGLNDSARPGLDLIFSPKRSERLDFVLILILT